MYTLVVHCLHVHDVYEDSVAMEESMKSTIRLENDRYMYKVRVYK